MTAHIILIRLPDCVTPVRNKGGKRVHSGGSGGIWKCSWWATPSLRSTGTLPVHCAIREDFWSSTNFGPFWFTPELKPKSFVLILLRCCPKGQSGSPSSPRHASPSYRKPHECTPCTRTHQRPKHSLIGPVKKKTTLFSVSQNIWDSTCLQPTIRLCVGAAGKVVSSWKLFQLNWTALP